MTLKSPLLSQKMAKNDCRIWWQLGDFPLFL
jgi:hypothetical protein